MRVGGAGGWCCWWVVVLVVEVSVGGAGGGGVGGCCWWSVVVVGGLYIYIIRYSNIYICENMFNIYLYLYITVKSNAKLKNN